MVTATTVGYGGLSPATDAGRVLASIFVVPGAIAIFTALLGKAITDISKYWKGRLMGRGKHDKKQGHVIVMGWQSDRTRRLIEGLINDDPADDQPILVAPSVQENPMPTHIDFVAAETLSGVKGPGRAGASGAKVIVVRGADDGEVDLNCPTDRPGGPGDVLYYIADHRLRETDIDWNLLVGEPA